MAIHILQLPKWKYDGTVKNEKERWIYLFKEGKNTDPDNPPDILDTEETSTAIRKFVTPLVMIRKGGTNL